ncbi:MAG: BT0820 family HAD-type phosphatase [Bacteroidota bacterium]
MLIDSKIIAVDFDGTIVEDRYPGIGKPLPFAMETLQLLQKDGHRLVLWTVRKGKTLEEAIEFCRRYEIEFYAVNQNFEGEDNFGGKLNADIFIDDRNIGGLPQWGEIYQMISGNERPVRQSKRSWLSRFFG